MEEPNCIKLQAKSESKQPKRGIIYLSTIPPFINVSKIREIFSQYGTVGRIYLQLDDLEQESNKNKKKKHRPGKKFIEGWIEFEKKSVAKKVALLLNNSQVSTRKKSKQYDSMWNIKYLSNFKWPHLHERLAYEKAERRQKLRAEIQLAKKKSSYFNSNLKHKKSKTVINKQFEDVNKIIVKTDEDETSHEENRKEFLESLFN